MKKKIALFLAISMIFVACLGVLAACGEEKEILSRYILEQEKQTVSKEFILPKLIGPKGGELPAVWTSDKENIVIEEREEDFLAKPVRPDSGTATVILTVKLNGKATKSFEVRVKGYDVYDIADAYYFKQHKQTVYAGTFDLDSEAKLGDKTATIEWEVPEEYSAILSVKDGKCTVVAPSTPTDVKIHAKMTYAGETALKTYKFTASASKSLKDAFLGEVIGTPKADTTYKFALYQGTNKKVLYALAEMDGNFIKTTEKLSEAADAKLETTTGGYFLKLGNKYVTLTGTWGGKYVKATVSLADAGTTVFTIGENHEFIAEVKAKDGDGVEQKDTFYLGTYSSYATISASATSYISGDKATTIDNSQFPARLVSLNEIKAEISLKDAYLEDVIASPKADTAYKLALYQGTNKKVLYALAEMDGNFIKTTEKPSEAATIKLVATDGGYFLKLGDKFITLTGSWSGKYVKAAVSLADAGSTVFVLGDNNTLRAEVSAKDTDGATQTDTFYIGTYSSYATISASSISYITGDKANTVDNSQFPARLVAGTVENSGEKEEVKVEPVVAESGTIRFLFTGAPNGAELTAEKALELFKTYMGGTDAAKLTSVAVTKVYQGNGTGGAHENKAGMLKMGTGSANGEIVITFDSSIKVEKVIIKCHDFYAKSDKNPTNTNQVAVNGATAVLAPYNETGAHENVTFTLTAPSNVITISSSNTGGAKGRITIVEIVLVLAK